MRAVAGISLVALFASNGMAICDQLDGAYYCTAEVSGGLSYDSSQKLWHGTAFNVDEKFVLRMTFIDTKHVQVQPQGPDGKPFLGTDGKAFKVPFDFQRYEAKITNAGTHETVYCEGHGSAENPPEQHKVVAGPYLFCTAWERDFIFQFVTKRFLMSYMRGYLIGCPVSLRM